MYRLGLIMLGGVLAAGVSPVLGEEAASAAEPSAQAEAPAVTPATMPEGMWQRMQEMHRQRLEMMNAQRAARPMPGGMQRPGMARPMPPMGPHRGMIGPGSYGERGMMPEAMRERMQQMRELREQRMEGVPPAPGMPAMVDEKGMGEAGAAAVVAPEPGMGGGPRAAGPGYGCRHGGNGGQHGPGEHHGQMAAQKQQRMAERQARRQAMEERMVRIEKMLQELIELQKAR